jgi:hypothetical protein
MLVPAKSGVGGSSIDMTSTTGGLVPTPPNDSTKFLNGIGTFTYPSSGWIDVRTHGAVCDGNWVYDITTNSTTTITSVIAPWTSSDVGKAITLKGVGVAGANLTTTIAAFVNSGQVTLASAASSSTTEVGAGWGTDDHVAVQAAITAAGRGGSVYIPAGKFCNLNGNNVATTAIEQHIFSFGGGLLNGDFNIAYRRCSLDNLIFAGPSNYGINVTDASYAYFILHPSELPYGSHEDRSTHCHVNNVQVWHKLYAIYNVVGSGLCRFFKFEVHHCDNGGYIDQSDFHFDSGDWHFTSCRFTGKSNPFTQTYSGIGFTVIKTGGLAFVDTKFQGWEKGIYANPSTAAVSTWLYPVNGIYITGCELEGNNSQDIYITAQTGVAAASYPCNIIITGGTIFNIVLDKCHIATITGTYITNGIIQNSGATQVSYVNITPATNLSAVPITGTGTDYLYIRNDATSGPIVQSGGALTIKAAGALTFKDTSYPAGKTLSQVYNMT